MDTQPQQSQSPVKFHPGLDLNCDNVEFFEHEGGVRAFKKGKMIRYDELPAVYHELIKNSLICEPDVKEILEEWHPDSEAKQCHTFMKCRFGGLDHNPDIKNMELQHGEWWDCPFKGNCKGEGVLCRDLSFNGSVIDATEIKLLRLMTTNLTNEALADEMSMPMGSFNLFKKNLYQKLGGIQTKQEATIITVQLNLI